MSSKDTGRDECHSENTRGKFARIRWGKYMIRWPIFVSQWKHLHSLAQMLRLGPTRAYDWVPIDPGAASTSLKTKCHFRETIKVLFMQGSPRICRHWRLFAQKSLQLSLKQRINECWKLSTCQCKPNWLLIDSFTKTRRMSERNNFVLPESGPQIINSARVLQPFGTIAFAEDKPGG